jgi:hypothetical protein
MRNWNIFQGNGYSFSAKAISYFVVNSCVAVSLACMSKTIYFTVIHVSAYDLRVTNQDEEGDFRLGRIKFCNEV